MSEKRTWRTGEGDYARWPSEVPAGVYLTAARAMHTRKIVNWSLANPPIRDKIAREAGEVERGNRQTYIRMSLLTLLGSFHDPQGPLLELHVRLIEAAMSMLDGD